MGKHKKPDGTAKPNSATRAKQRAWKCIFLEQLTLTANVTASALAAGRQRNTIYDMRNADPAFAAQWDDAIEKSVDALEQEARRRAYEGDCRKKFTSRGEPIIDPETGEHYIEREYSDKLMIQLLKAHRPKKFVERQQLALEGDLDLHIERLVPFGSGDQDDDDPA